MKAFAVIDTNVLVSALLSRHGDSATSIILANLFSETIVPLYNDEILNEYEEVLHRTKFHFPEKAHSLLPGTQSIFLKRQLLLHLPSFWKS